jgi:hypothetical protein
MGRWWQSLPEVLRSPWPMALAGATVFALVMGFHHVVANAVRQGEALRMNVVTKSDATWRCQALQNRHARAQCLDAIESSSTSIANATPPPNTAFIETSAAVTR